MGKENKEDFIQVLKGASLRDPATGQPISLKLAENISWEDLSDLVGGLIGKAIAYSDQTFRGRLQAVLSTLLSLAQEPDTINLPAQKALAALEREMHGLSLTTANDKIRDSLPEVSALLKFGYYLDAKIKLNSIAQVNKGPVTLLNDFLEQIIDKTDNNLIFQNMAQNKKSLNDTIKQAEQAIKNLDQLYRTSTTNKSDLVDKIFSQIRMLEQAAQYHPDQQISHAAIACLQKMKENKELLPFILTELKDSPALKAKSAPGKLESEKAQTNEAPMKKPGMFLAAKHRAAPSAASPTPAAAEPIERKEKKWTPGKLHD